MASKAPPAEKRQVAQELERRLQAYCAEVLFSPDFEARLRESQADLLLVDSTYPFPALTALRLGLRAAIFSTTLPLRADATVPPLTSAAPPPAGAWSRFKTKASWTLLANGGRGGYGKFVREQIQELSRRHPDLGRLCDFRTHLQHGPVVDIDTLIACGAEFDFPRASMEHLHYVGPCVDLERAGPPLPPEVADDARPLLYCSLGSLGHRTAMHRPFFQAVLDMIARKPDWRLLMSVGTNLPVAGFQIPSNATVVPFASQLAALRKARVMLTHGGLNSVKECICLGVPMLVFPTGLDQPGNAARIVHHGLGRLGSIRKTTPESLAEMLDTVAGDPGYHSRVSAMRDLFIAADEEGRGAMQVERLLQEPRTSAAPRQAAAS